MGYEDRDYMRDDDPARTGSGGSNPLWWILGLIALVLVVGLVRRGSQPEMTELAAVTRQSGLVMLYDIQFAPGAENSRSLVRVLRDFYRGRGYESIIRESADDSFTMATFTEPLVESDNVVPHIQYAWVREGSPEMQAAHHLNVRVYISGSDSADGIIQKLTQESKELLQRLESEVPGSVLRVDDEPRSMGFDE